MFLRSCASAFRQYVNASPRPLLSRTILTNLRHCSGNETTSDDEAEKKNLAVDYSKRVTVVLRESDGSIRKEIGFVGERLYDLVKRVDKEKDYFGVCQGCTSCSTCHVILEEKYCLQLPPPTDQEQDLIDQAPESCNFSRMSCTTYITEEMEGMVVKFPSVVADFYVEENKSNGS